LVQPAELVGTKRYKIGCSSKPTLDRVKNGYKRGTRYLGFRECENPFAVENELKRRFCDKFSLIAGKEYFEGDEEDIIREFVEVAYGGTQVPPNPLLNGGDTSADTSGDTSVDTSGDTSGDVSGDASGDASVDTNVSRYTYVDNIVNLFKYMFIKRNKTLTNTISTTLCNSGNEVEVSNEDTIYNNISEEALELSTHLTLSNIIPDSYKKYRNYSKIYDYIKYCVNIYIHKNIFHTNFFLPLCIYTKDSIRNNDVTEEDITKISKSFTNIIIDNVFVFMLGESVYKDELEKDNQYRRLLFNNISNNNNDDISEEKFRKKEMCLWLRINLFLCKEEKSVNSILSLLTFYGKNQTSVTQTTISTDGNCNNSINIRETTEDISNNMNIHTSIDYDKKYEFDKLSTLILGIIFYDCDLKHRNYEHIFNYIKYCVDLYLYKHQFELDNFINLLHKKKIKFETYFNATCRYYSDAESETNYVIYQNLFQITKNVFSFMIGEKTQIRLKNNETIIDNKNIFLKDNNYELLRKLLEQYTPMDIKRVSIDDIQEDNAYRYILIVKTSSLFFESDINIDFEVFIRLSEISIWFKFLEGIYSKGLFKD